MIVDAVGAFLRLFARTTTSFRRHHTVIDDGRGNLMPREDTDR